MRGWWLPGALLFLGGLLGPSRELGQEPLPGPRREGEVRGIWFFRSRPTDWDAVMEELRRAGLNSIFVRVGRGGNVIYPSQVLPTEAWARELPHDEVLQAIEAAHRHGIAFHAWRVCFHMGSAPRDDFEKLAREDRLVRDPQGKQAHWANPADPRNFETELRAFVELVERYPLDGIHFDYIRYPDEPHFFFDYGEVSRRRFQEEMGITVARWPQDVLEGPLQLAYEDWCRRQIDRLVEAVHREVKRRKPWVQISAAVWRHHYLYSTVIKQNWPLWLEKGWLDFAVPMDYVPQHGEFEAKVREQVSLARGRGGMVIGIGAWLLKRPEDVLRQVEILRHYGADGFVLFSYNAEQIHEHLDALSQGPTQSPTFPAYLAPQWLVEAPGAVAWPDEPLRVVAGRAWDLRATLRVRPVRPARPVALVGRVGLEDGEGRLLAELGSIRMREEEKTFLFRAPMPQGLFQVVLRGRWRLADGSSLPFVARGPLFLGVDLAEYQAYWARFRPPRPPGKGLRVAVWHDGWAAEDVMEALRQMPGVVPFWLYFLSRPHLQNADVLILPPCRDLRLFWAPTLVGLLRNWVEEGHTLLLCHDAVGARWHPRLFPEIGVGGERVPLKAVRWASAPEGLPPAFSPGSSSGVRLRLAPGAKVWLTEEGEGTTPIVAEGRWGRGRVILCGLLLGGGEKPVTEPETQLLKALLGLPISAWGETS